ncbi:MAG TPA: PAS domain-containing protein, partial [Pyrinomonadaceae bacterium]|nr:PAS domain-containing protein [Pyrinomonadaceae bacterium]
MANGIHFRSVTDVGRQTVLGETLSYPIAVPNPWMLLLTLSQVLLTGFFLDASVRSWRRGEHRQAFVFGTGTILFGVTTLVIPSSVLWGLLPIPLFGSFNVLFIVVAMLYELNYDMHRSAMAKTEAVGLGRRLAEIVSNVPGIVWESRTEIGTKLRKTTFISAYVQRMLGYTPEEWLKQPPGFGARIMPEEDRESAIRESDEVIETGTETVSQFRWFTKDGRIRWVENHLAPIVDEQAGIVGLRGVALDVTERYVAQQAVREREAQLAETLDQLQLSAAAANVGMWTRKIGEEKMWFSEKAGEIWGFSSPDEFTRESFIQKIHEADRELFFAALREVEAGRNEFHVEYRILGKDGSIRWVHSRGKVETVNEARFIRGAIVDITKLKIAEEAIHELSHKLMNAQEKERARLARELHDDLSQNIALLSINLEILSNEPKDLEYVKDQLRRHISTVKSLSSDVHRISHELHPAKLIHLGLET